MNCSKCGANNDDGDAYCIYCGESMRTESDAAFKPAAKRGKRGLIIGISAAVVAVVAIAAVLLITLNSAPVFGNSPINIRNGGFAAESGGWIYYSNSVDEYSLYKIRTDGTGKMKLNSEGSTSINVAGGWVYYLNQSAVRKVRMDGTDRETIYDEVKVGRIYIYQNWIYYTASSDNDVQMYRMRLDGSGSEELDMSLAMKPFNDVDGWSYANSKDGLSKVRSDGTGREILTSDNANCVNAANGWVYYANVSDGGSLYKIRTDGAEKTKLNDDRSGHINIVGDWIYYVNEDDSYDFYRMKTDGSQIQRVD